MVVMQWFVDDHNLPQELWSTSVCQYYKGYGGRLEEEVTAL